VVNAQAGRVPEAFGSQGAGPAASRAFAIVHQPSGDTPVRRPNQASHRRRSWRLLLHRRGSARRCWSQHGTYELREVGRTALEDFVAPLISAARPTARQGRSRLLDILNGDLLEWRRAASKGGAAAEARGRRRCHGGFGTPNDGGTRRNGCRRQLRIPESATSRVCGNALTPRLTAPTGAGPTTRVAGASPPMGHAYQRERR
jgi:hypothetical protein